MTEEDKDRQLLELVKELRDLHAEVVPLRVEFERYVKQVRDFSVQLGVVPSLLHVVDGRLVDSVGADVVFPGPSDFVRVLGRLRDLESGLGTVRAQLAELGVPFHAPDSSA